MNDHWVHYGGWHLLSICFLFTLTTAAQNNACLSGNTEATPCVTYGGDKNVSVAVGQTAVLSCSVHQLNRNAVSWIRKRDLRILTTDIFTYTSDARFQVAHSEGSGNWTLLVTYSQTRDTGVYECQINTEPKKSLAFNLHVMEAVARIQGPRQVYTRHRSSLRLTCVVNIPNSHVPAELGWMHNGTLLDARLWNSESSRDYLTSTVEIKTTRRRHSGKYTCAPRGAAFAHVTVHVINDEHPAAMQHENVASSRTPPPLTLLFMLLLTTLFFTFPLIDE